MFLNIAILPNYISSALNFQQIVRFFMPYTQRNYL